MRFLGEFKDGEINGNSEIEVDNKRKYKTKFDRGIEMPQSMALKEITLDRAYFNLVLCALIFIIMIIGGIFKMQIMYIAIGLYVIQICDYCCSSTRTVFNNMDTLESARNLLLEYQRWRPIVVFHYKSQKLKQHKASKKNKIMAVLEDEEAKKKMSIDEINSI
jgi:hypothetical protein